tara:strand:+ start:356 stop:895 length:540 start_codon:yes stop_codon:yes gene_type:complete
MFTLKARTFMPKLLVDSARFKRAHIACVKKAVRLTLLEYQQTDLKQHFKATNRQKYNHQKRRDSYKAMKRRKYGSITDLKKTGKTERYMKTQRAKVAVRGNQTSNISGTMFLRFPFPITAKDNNPRGVAPRQMMKEIETWAREERVRAAKNFERHYISEMKDKLKNSPTHLATFKSYYG